MDECTRCHAPVPREMPTEGTRYQIRMRRRETTVVHRLVFSMHRFRWMTEDPADQIRTSYTDLTLCDPCAVKVFDFAQGKTERSEA